MACVQNRLNVAVPELGLWKVAGPSALERGPLPVQWLLSEREFYASYPWSLNIYLTVREAIAHLRRELIRPSEAKEPWQLAEIMTNGFLLFCAVANEIDDYLVGKGWDVSAIAKLPLGRRAARTVETLVGYGRRIRERRLSEARAWRERWQAEMDRYLEIFVRDTLGEAIARPASEVQLAPAFERGLPADLLDRRLKNPAFFHGRDLTHFDILMLGEKFATQFPDRQRRIVIVGLRTAGSYFAPLLRSYLKTQGYKDVDLVTMRPRSPLGEHEKAHLGRCGREGRTAVIVDESPIGGGSTADVIKVLQKIGYQEERMGALLPIHRLHRDWRKGWDKQKIKKAFALTLEPEEWHKQRALAAESAEETLTEYFRARGYRSARLINSAAAERLNVELQLLSEEKYHTRHKRIYEVCLEDGEGTVETRYVLAKSVGWGWLSYRAFLASERLSQFVPPVLGLRNGFLYTEWRPQTESAIVRPAEEHLNQMASYVATRARSMSLNDDPTADLVRDKQHAGFEELINTLSRAYGSRTARFFKRRMIQHELARRSCPFPALIDGKMRRIEWIAESSSLLKTDFEHHGMGKKELEITDPAYDLAEAILYFALSEKEEQQLVRRYIEESGDQDVGKRLFLNKVLAGTWSMNQALANIADIRLWHRSQESNQRYLDACSFLTTQTMRFCASFCSRPKNFAWRSPIVVLDIDGVLDRPVFGFPSTTAAGIEALSLLHSHDFAIALDTARSVSEVKEYCRNYGLVGGVAEYGSAIWDEVAQQERVLASSEALAQLEALREALRKLPGVFLNDDYQYSIRAYTYNKQQTAALPTLLIQTLLARLNLNHLRLHQTGVDTAILAKDVDKGTGLSALVGAIGATDPRIIAIGDSDPDLAMFRIATQSFAPSHIWCRGDAEKLGCHIASQPLQSGLLESVRSFIHSNAKSCKHCGSCETRWRQSGDLFLRLLEVADWNKTKLLTKTVTDILALKAFA